MLAVVVVVVGKFVDDDDDDDNNTTKSLTSEKVANRYCVYVAFINKRASNCQRLWRV